MSLVYNDDERMLAEAARGFLQQNASPAVLRGLRDTRDADGFSRELWREMAALGWAGMLVPEEFGGLGFAHTGAGILCEQAGRRLAASPLFATAILGATLIREAGTQAQKQVLLPAIAAGRRLCALALDESARHDPAGIALVARANGDAFRLLGEKILVLDGHVADTLVVAARSRGAPGETHGISLFLVEAGSAGVAIERTVMVDSRNAAIVRFCDARGELLGALHQGWNALERTLDIGRICLAAEMLGVAGEALARTVDYLRSASSSAASSASSRRCSTARRSCSASWSWRDRRCCARCARSTSPTPRWRLSPAWPRSRPATPRCWRSTRPCSCTGESA